MTHHLLLPESSVRKIPLFVVPQNEVVLALVTGSGLYGLRIRSSRFVMKFLMSDLFALKVLSTE